MTSGKKILRGGLLLLLTASTACDESSLPGENLDSGQVNLPDSAADSGDAETWQGPPLLEIASLPDSIFEIDDAEPSTLPGANLKVDTAGNLDWAAAGIQSDITVVQDEPSGSGDDSFGQGTKEDTEVPSQVTGSIPPNKSDLKQFGLYVESNMDGDFLHLFWTRVQDPSGTTNMDFEFNQSDTPFVRTGGDMLAVYELTKGGRVPELFLHRWMTGVAPWDGPCEAANSYPCWGAQQDLTGVAIGSINNDPIPANEWEDMGTSVLGALDARTFGEASIDLGAIFGEGECFSFGQAYLKSRSSDSFTSAVKDYIAPVPINLTNCGKVIIRKETTPDGDTTDFGFTHNLVFQSPPPQGTTFDLADGESITFGGVFFNDMTTPTYTITEDDLSGTGFSLDDIDCSASSATVSVTEDEANQKVQFSLDQAADVVDCTFYNEALGTIIIEKKLTIDGQPSTAFDFSEDSGLLSPFMLTVTGTTADTKTFSNIAVGTYEITEAAETGFQLTDISCSGGSSTSTAGSTATINLKAGETVTCTFTNEPIADLKIVKEISGSGYSNVVFPFAVDAFPDNPAEPGFNLTASSGSPDDKAWTDILVGDYGFTESAPSGWRVKSISCTGNNTAETVNTATGELDVTIAPGESVVCTYINEPIGQLEIIKQIDGTGYTNVEFPYSASGPSIVTSPFSLFPSSGSPDNNDYGTVLAGNYDFDEDVPSGWRVKSISCTGNATNETVDLMAGTLDVDVAPGEDVVCTFVNEPISGLRIIKQVEGSGYSNVQFDFTASGTDAAVTGFSLFPSSGSPDNQTWMNILAGSYNVDEDIPSGWRIKSISCTGNANMESANTSTGELSVTLAAGEFVECTYVNEAIATLTIRKALSNVDLGLSTFSFVTANAPGGNFNLSATGTTTDEKVYTDILAGTYNFDESDKTGWRISGLSCTGNNTPEVASTVSGELAITLEPGENVVCTYTNEPLAQVSANFFSLGGSDVLQMKVQCDTDGGGPTVLTQETVLDLLTSSKTSEIPIGIYNCQVIVEARP